MEAQNKGGQQAAGTEPVDVAQDQIDQQTRDITEAYERARREMNDAVARLRAEIEKVDVAQATQKAQDWIEENPTLAAAIAVGGGIVFGKLLASTFRAVAPPPPTLPERLRHRAFDYADLARDYASDIGEAIAAGAAVAGSTLAMRAAGAGGSVARRAADFGETVAERVSEVSGDVRKAADKAAHELQHDARDLSKTVKKKASAGVDFGETAIGAAKTVVAAVLVKKITDWVRKMA
ncbi:MAG TPA: hypothetical protein VFG50_11940 [Rhodothermales bacterium]|nr:hypothetical protein [Rhodothermales bacterium]